MEILQVQDEKSLQLIEHIAKEIWEEHYTPIIGKEQVSYMLETFQSRQVMQKQIENEKYQYYMFKEGNKEIGYMAVAPKQKSLFLSKLYIKKEYRGLGYSKQAIQYIYNVCDSNTFDAIYLTCNKNNSQTLKAYQHLGFNITGEEVTDIGNGYVMDDYILKKDVTSCK